MKKSIITLLALAGVAAGASENTIILTFGTANGKGISYNTTGAFLGVSGQTYNILSTTGAGGEEFDTLKYADNSSATGISVHTGQAVCGVGGRVTTITNAAKVDEVFSSSLMSGVVNYTADTTITFNGLTTGQSYTMYVFAGRGNEYSAGYTTSAYTNTYSLTSGAKDVTAQIISSTTTTADRPAPVVSTDKTAITAFTQSCDGAAQTCENWVIMSFDFTANASSVGVKGTGSGTKSFGAIALVSNVPEPTTATLSLLALAGLAARRRRK